MLLLSHHNKKERQIILTKVKGIPFLIEKYKYSTYLYFHLENRIVNYAQPIVSLQPGVTLHRQVRTERMVGKLKDEGETGVGEEKEGRRKKRERGTGKGMKETHQKEERKGSGQGRGRQRGSAET